MRAMSLDAFTLAVAVTLVLLAIWAALTTRSRVMRIALVLIASVIVALMVWNLATHGGLHAV